MAPYRKSLKVQKQSINKQIKSAFTNKCDTNLNKMSLEKCRMHVNAANHSRTSVSKVLHPSSIKIGKHHIDTCYPSAFPSRYAGIPTLYFCEFCLSYSKSPLSFSRHERKCTIKKPPGIEIYQHKDVSVFEVDGGINGVYCKNLCLISKLFLEEKTRYDGLDDFWFYILTKNDKSGRHIVGYFSKAKHSLYNHNLACVLTLPQYQRQGFGKFLIDFSYLLTRREGLLGTPEKPLSEMGKRTYSSYWKSVVVECLYKLRCDHDITVQKISNETGLTKGDALSTLRKLKAQDNIHLKLHGKNDLDNLALEYKKLKKIKRIPLRLNCLRWRRTNHEFQGNRYQLRKRKVECSVKCDDYMEHSPQKKICLRFSNVGGNRESQLANGIEKRKKPYKFRRDEDDSSNEIKVYS